MQCGVCSVARAAARVRTNVDRDGAEIIDACAVLSSTMRSAQLASEGGVHAEPTTGGCVVGGDRWAREPIAWRMIDGCSASKDGKCCRAYEIAALTEPEHATTRNDCTRSMHSNGEPNLRNRARCTPHQSITGCNS